MTTGEQGEAAIARILGAYPALTSEAAVAFLYICAEEGLSLKALSKRLDDGQSTVARHVAALERLEPDGIGLVVLSGLKDGALRRTVHLSPVGTALRDEINKAVTGQT